MWAALAAVLAVAAAARVLGWGSWSLWLDEAMQVDATRHGLAGLFRLLLSDGAHPPLEFLVTMAVRRLSESDAALRTPAVVWSLGATLALFWRCGGPRRPEAALPAALVFATLPLAVHYGQEVRPYALALFLVALADAARASFVRTGSRRMLALHVAAAVAASYTLYIALWALGLVWAVELLEAWKTRREDRARLLAALAVPAVVGLLFSPWLVALRGLAARPVEAAAPHVSVGLLGRYAVALAADREPSGRVVAALAVWGLAAIGIARTGSGERRRLLVSLAGTTAGVLALFTLANHWWSPRYVIMGVLPLAAAAGEGVAAVAGALRGTGRAAAAVALSLLLAAVQLPALAENVRTGRPDWRRVADYLAYQRARGRGGTVVAADPWAFFSLRGQALRLSPPLPEGPVTPGSAELARALTAARSGWVVRAPRFAGAGDVDAALGAAAPWGRFEEAEGALLYRFEAGRLLPP